MTACVNFDHHSSSENRLEVIATKGKYTHVIDLKNLKKNEFFLKNH